MSWTLALALSIPGLGLERVCPRKGCPWPRIYFVFLALASSLVSSTPPLVYVYLALYNFTVMLWELRSTPFFNGFGSRVWWVWACECFTWSWGRYFYRFFSNCYITFETFPFVFRNRSAQCDCCTTLNLIKTARYDSASCVQVSGCTRSPKCAYKFFGSKAKIIIKHLQFCGLSCN